MINRRNIALFSLLIVFGIYILKQWSETSSPHLVSPAAQTKPVPSSYKIDGKKVFGLKPGKEAEEIKKLKVTNVVSRIWKSGLTKSLNFQAGETLKNIEIKTVDSFIWALDGLALNVESVIVTLKNSKNQETSFRAMVDASNGKILKNWDQPVFDPANPRDNFGVKLDPRYHNE